MWAVLLTVTVTVTACLTGLASSGEVNICNGPAGTPCTSATMSCESGQVILLEPKNKMKKFQTKNANYCRTDQPHDQCPAYTDTDKELTLSTTERNHVFSQCSNQRVCDLKMPYNKSGIEFSYISIPFYCLPNKNNMDILKIDRSVFPEHVSLYLPRNSTINRKYTIESSLPLTTKMLYVYLGRDSCSKVVLTSNNESLWQCSDEVMGFGETLEVKNLQMEMLFTNLTLKEGEYLWLQFTADADISITSTSLQEKEEIKGKDITYLPLYFIILVLVLVLVVVVVICVSLLIYFKRKRNKQTKVSYSLATKVTDTEPEVEDGTPEPLYSEPLKKKRPEVEDGTSDPLYSQPFFKGNMD